MPMMIDSKDIDIAMQRLARQQPTLTTKTGMALSILRRAMLLTPAELDAWLRAGLEPADDHQRRQETFTAENAGSAEKGCK